MSDDIDLTIADYCDDFNIDSNEMLDADAAHILNQLECCGDFVKFRHKCYCCGGDLDDIKLLQWNEFGPQLCRKCEPDPFEELIKKMKDKR